MRENGEEMNENTMSGRRTEGRGAGAHPEWKGTLSGAETARSGGGVVLAGRYRVVRRLGEGGMGSVWLAEDLKLDGRKVAVKMLPSVLVSNKRAYRQLKDEALTAMKLSHSNIVTLRAFEEEDGAPFLVMDYIDGQTLDDLLAEKRTLSGEETAKLLGPVAAALDYAHSKGVVHRDVKPGNVMVGKDGTPYILDFGIARKIQETLTRVTGKMSSGTLLYMSPEQLNGDAPKAAQDVYSFAAMAYECLTGHPPFCRGAIEDQIKNKVPDELPTSVGEELRRGVMGGLAKLAEERPGTCAGVLGAVGAKNGDSENRRMDNESRRADREKVPGGTVARPAKEAAREKGRSRGGVFWIVGILLMLVGFAAYYLTEASHRRNTISAHYGEPVVSSSHHVGPIDATDPSVEVIPEVGNRYKVFVEDESDDHACGIAHIGGRTTFIPDARRGQLVIVDVTQVRPNVVNATLVRVISQPVSTPVPPVVEEPAATSPVHDISPEVAAKVLAPSEVTSALEGQNVTVSGTVAAVMAPKSERQPWTLSLADPSTGSILPVKYWDETRTTLPREPVTGDIFEFDGKVNVYSGKVFLTVDSKHKVKFIAAGEKPTSAEQTREKEATTKRELADVPPIEMPEVVLDGGPELAPQAEFLGQQPAPCEGETTAGTQDWVVAERRFNKGNALKAEAQQLEEAGNTSGAMAKYAEALTEFYNVFVKYGGGPYGALAGEEAKGIKGILETRFGKTVKIDLPQTPFALADSLFRKGAYGDAAAAYERGLEANAATDEATVRAFACLMQCYVQLDDVDAAQKTAARLHEKVGQSSPFAPLAAKAVLAAGQLFRQEKDDQAMMMWMFEHYLDWWPGDEQAGQMLFYLATLAEKAGNMGKADEYLSRILKGDHRDTYHARALCKQGWNAYAARDYATAEKRLRNYLKETEEERTFLRVQTMFALADCLRRNGEGEEAVELFTQLEGLLSGDTAEQWTSEENGMAQKAQLLEQTRYWRAFTLVEMDGDAERRAGVVQFENFMKLYPNSTITPKPQEMIEWTEKNLQDPVAKESTSTDGACQPEGHR